MSGEGARRERLRDDHRRLRRACRRGRAGPAAVELFRRIVREFYRDYGRRFPWRRTRDPYRIVVSEFMLQQTQVQRVAAKYDGFLERFPDVGALAGAGLADVLAAWQGLGYNRRARALREAARIVVGEHGGRVPRGESELRGLPGVGQATAGAVRAFAFGLPAVFVETNVRRVFIHFFFPRRRQVEDRALLPLVAETLDRSDPRLWYYALMDYGASLKAVAGNPNRRSAFYRRQPPFEGSDRQVRGAVLRTLLREGSLGESELLGEIGVAEDRGRRILDALRREGFVLLGAGRVSIA